MDFVPEHGRFCEVPRSKAERVSPCGSHRRADANRNGEISQTRGAWIDQGAWLAEIPSDGRVVHAGESPIRVK